MRKLIFICLGILVFVVLVIGVLYFVYAKGEARYQADATTKRISDIYEIAQYLEDCKSKQGYYPFVDLLRESPGDGYVTVPLAVMLSQPDQDWVNKQRFPFSMSIGKRPTSSLIEELSRCLNQDISLPVDPQRRPSHAPNTYIILFTEDDSYVAISFLYEEESYTSPLAKNVHAFAVSSALGPVAQQILNGMRINPKKFTDIPQSEIKQARAEGAKMDAMFSNWATVRVKE